MTVECKNCPLRQKECFQPFSPQELSFTQGFKSGELSVDAGTTIQIEGSETPHLYTVLSGMGVRYKTLENGRRQVINFILPGDFVGLQAGVMGEAGHSVEATTPMVLCTFRRSDLWRLFQNHPGRAYDLVWLAASEEAFLGQSLVTVGQRKGLERVSWALLKLFDRLKHLGLAKGNRVPLPYRQQDVADALGLSLVHTNKTLGVLRSRHVARWSDGELQILDRETLQGYALVEEEDVGQRPLI
ncbi:Crp/Fnr family transcriptional regulator [Celeribacter ethanolicus]|uniref:Crp/Fnr family transcriptional regulator n=1 Tax=Celeribacter ethanolicus TaxID=1758178 RepID=A0A291GDQ7_9RHOB|nr:Crp/Fnr family transcriptional regulator [Celeribacter ethanolicus]TNE65741.1 MAG: Crp/Fnr family transcriptional regulator [Paracoccaceae bacterium]